MYASKVIGIVQSKIEREIGLGSHITFKRALLREIRLVKDLVKTGKVKRPSN